MQETIEMTDYTPLYIEGKRDSRKRFVSPSGDIISYRQYIKKTEGVTPEQKALRRYQAGLSKKGKTVKKIEEREKRKKEKPYGVPPKPGKLKKYPGEVTEVVEMSRDRGYYQLSGRYEFINRKWKLRASAIGYSTASADKKRLADLDILREQAINYAQATLPHSGWEVIGIDYEHWLKW